jgi:hypothetical protein
MASSVLFSRVAGMAVTTMGGGKRAVIGPAQRRCVVAVLMRLRSE